MRNYNSVQATFLRCTNKSQGAFNLTTTNKEPSTSLRVVIIRQISHQQAPHNKQLLEQRSQQTTQTVSTSLKSVTDYSC